MTVEPEGPLFEPSPETAAHLRTVLAREGLEKLEVIERAASERAGQAVFYAEPGFGETSNLFTAANGLSALAVPVTLTRLADELSARSLTQIDFLKVDAEGNDLNALLGGENYIPSRRISVIQFEYNSPWMLCCI